MPKPVVDPKATYVPLESRRPNLRQCSIRMGDLDPIPSRPSDEPPRLAPSLREFRETGRWPHHESFIAHMKAQRSTLR